MLCSAEISSDELCVLFDKNNYALKGKLLMLIFRSPCCSGGLAAVPFPSVLCSGPCSFSWACESLVTIKMELFGTLLFSSTVKFKEKNHSRLIYFSVFTAVAQAAINQFMYIYN